MSESCIITAVGLPLFLHALTLKHNGSNITSGWGRAVCRYDTDIVINNVKIHFLERIICTTQPRFTVMPLLHYVISAIFFTITLDEMTTFCIHLDS